MTWLDRYTVQIHLAVILAGVTAFVAAIMTGEWRLLFLSAFAWWFTVGT